MAINLTSPVTGAPQNGLTSPTYTHVVDTAPQGTIGKQYAVTALGGTQTGVAAHSVASPFTTTFFKPGTLKVLGAVNPSTGLLRAVPKNTYKCISRKGVLPLAGQPASLAMVETNIIVPAGSDTADPLSLKALLSLHIGALQQLSAQIGDTVLTAIL